MTSKILPILLISALVHGKHFNGGSIRWEPVNPNVNSSSVKITLTQTYSWAYPSINCANNVPISTSGRSGENTNLTCVADCSTSGGYSSAPVNILTDCVSTSQTLGMLTSQRSTNITLAAGSHFYLAYRGSAWVALNNPATSGLYWSILCFIDLRMRPDGIINTPPVSTVVSPQYAIVNRTTQIQVPVSDANEGDDIRCRWSVYTPGYRKRRETMNKSDWNMPSTTTGEPILIRHKRGKNPCSGGACTGACKQNCPCFCSICASTTCSSSKCTTSTCSPISTTPETIPTLPTTIPYASRQAIDECGGICYPSSVPNGTTLSNCTITFKGLKANTWYAVSL